MERWTSAKSWKFIELLVSYWKQTHITFEEHGDTFDWIVVKIEQTVEGVGECKSKKEYGSIELLFELGDEKLEARGLWFGDLIQKFWELGHASWWRLRDILKPDISKPVKQK